MTTDAALDREMAYTDWRTSCRAPHPDHPDIACRRAPHADDHAAGFGGGRVRWANDSDPRPGYPVVPIAQREDPC